MQTLNNSPPVPNSTTPADLMTPHEEKERDLQPILEPELPQGIVDPRHLSGPEILQPAPPGLPIPSDLKPLIHKSDKSS